MKTVWEKNGPIWSGPIHGAPGLFWAQQQYCRFDAETAQRYGHCQMSYQAIFNCNTKTATWQGYPPPDPSHGSPIEPGSDGDQICRKNGYL